MVETVPEPQRVVSLEYSPGYLFAERYEILDRAGVGPASVVYKARDLGSGFVRALKLVRPNAAQNRRVLAAYRTDLKRFQGCVHRNLVRVHETGDAGGIAYLAADFIEGETLEHRRPESGETLSLVLQMLDGLQCLHDAGVVHGGLSPRNLMLTRDGVLKILEFGIVRDARQSMLAEPSAGAACSAPEQVLGRSLSFSSDLYSVGAIAYEWLTGHPPHAGLAVVDRCTAPPPRIGQEAPGVPPALAAAIEKCLEPGPGSRFQSVEELREALRAPASPARKGRTLEDEMESGPRRAAEVTPLFCRVCARLRSIHDEGLSHSDLSPQAIGLAPDGAVEIAAFPAPPANATALLFAPKYCPPESLLSASTSDGAQHVGGDIYVLGLLLYETIAGRAQFEAQIDSAGSHNELKWMEWHADRARQLQPLEDCPQPLADLVARMTAKDAALRPKSLEEVEQALTQLERRLEDTQELEVVRPAREAPNSAPPPRRRRRRAAVWALAAVVTAALAVAASMYLRGGAAAFGLRSGPAAPAPVPDRLPIPGGEFVMGDDSVGNEAPAHRVFLPSFFLDRVEVTNRRYQEFCDRTGRPYPPAPAGDPGYFSKGDYPVMNVSWEDARAFCADAGKRLPSEAEWEKAARGAAPSSLQWANWTVSGLANLRRAGPAAAGSFASDVSPFGVRDMAGNLHEWTADDYTLYPGNAAVLPPAPSHPKVVRGGSYALAPPGLSPAWRASMAPELVPGQDSPVGFRCAADAK